MKKIGIYTLGCRVNTYESQAIGELFEQNGFELADFDGFCDVYVVNSCSVTNMGDKKSRQELRKARKKNKNSVCILTGCYAQYLIKKGEEFNDADIIAGVSEKGKIYDLYLKFLEERKKITSGTDMVKERVFNELKISDFEQKTRAMLKIQDGCDRYCTYCIIPYLRGPVKSRSIKNITDEAVRLKNAGFKEIVLTGIEVARYGADTNEGSLIDVVKAVSDTGIERIRIGSLEPVAADEEFLESLKSLKAFCPSFHLSLQSGCNETLNRMNRRYTAEMYTETVENLRKYFPDAAVTTDIIVGFPGETEEEFKESLNFAKKICFSHIHIFPYSKRKGTKAAEMEGQIPKNIKDERVKLMNEVSKEGRAAFLDKMYGKTFSVLFETVNKDGFFEGMTENGIEVSLKSDKDLRGVIVPVEIREDNCR